MSCSDLKSSNMTFVVCKHKKKSKTGRFPSLSLLNKFIPRWNFERLPDRADRQNRCNDRKVDMSQYITW